MNSYFPSVISSLSSRLGNAYYSAIQQRPSDFYVMQTHSPVGWSFFSKSNVDALLGRLHNVQFHDICDDMVIVYEGNGEENPLTRDTVVKQVQVLNDILLRRLAEKKSINNKNSLDYLSYLRQPGGAQTWPTYEREDRTLYIDKRNKII
jgi:hypothetical protein